MILVSEKSLEMLVKAEEELLLAVRSLREKLTERAEEEATSAVQSLREKLLPEEDEEQVNQPAELDALSSVVEQQMDSESFENTSYSINTPYESSSYETGKNYYELIVGDDDKPVGASFTAVMSAYEHEFLQEAQNIANGVREGDNANHPFVEAQIDTNQKYIKESVKLMSPGLWQVMYEGKLTFN